MKRTARWVGIGLGSLVGLLVVALGVVYGVSEYRIRKTYAVDPPELLARTDAAAFAAGRHIAVTRGCLDCHGENGGGRAFIESAPLARLFASNLTRGAGGIGAGYTDRDWIRAIRHGIGPDRKPLLFMPSHEFNSLSDEDMSSLVAYLKNLPPVDNALQENSVGPLGRVLFVTGQLPLLPVELIDHDAPRAPAPAPGVTVEYGAYLATGCTGCHGNGMAGGKIPGTPPDFPAAANLTSHETGLQSWTEEDFFRLMRTGTRPDGSEVDPFMPWKAAGKMTDDELRALWLYLRSLPPRELGAR